MGFIDSLGKRYTHLAPWVLRFGLAIVFILFGVHKLQAPAQTASEVQYLFNLQLKFATFINFYVGLLEIGVALLLFSGKKIRLAGLLAAGMTFMIFLSFVVKNKGLGVDPNLYRDLGLSGMGLALFFLGKGEKENVPPILPQ